MRLTRAARCSGVTAISAMMVEQLGLAMMPPWPPFIPSIAWWVGGVVWVGGWMGWGGGGGWVGGCVCVGGGGVMISAPSRMRTHTHTRTLTPPYTHTPLG